MEPSWPSELRIAWGAILLLGESLQLLWALPSALESAVHEACPCMQGQDCYAPLCSVSSERAGLDWGHG